MEEGRMVEDQREWTKEGPEEGWKKPKIEPEENPKDWNKVELERTPKEAKVVELKEHLKSDSD